MDIYAALQCIGALSGIGDIQRLRQEAANRSSAALYEGDKAWPQYAAFLVPELDEAPWAPRDAARKRPEEQEKVRRERNAVRTSFLNAGHLAFHYLQYIIAGEPKGGGPKGGGLPPRILPSSSQVDRKELRASLAARERQ